MRDSGGGGRITPTWDPPSGPDGYGEPHPPAGGKFRAEAQALIQAAQAWDDVAAALKKVYPLIMKGFGRPGLFGLADTLYAAGTIHSEMNADLLYAAQDGYVTTTSLANGLVETANDFENTDTTVGNNFRTLETRAEDG